MKTGDKHSKLTALSPTHSGKWNFLCDCGTVSEKDANNVKEGKTKSCGCLRRAASKRNGNAQSIDMKGARYGSLTVTRRAPSAPEHTGARWICECDCGRQRIAYGIKLREGKINSCGACN